MTHRKCHWCDAILQTPRFSICESCEAKWNAGARWADLHWADDPQVRYQDEHIDGYSLLRGNQGYYNRRPGEPK